MSTISETRTAYSVRTYGTEIGDYQTVSGWYRAHHDRDLDETYLPPVGVVVEQGGEPVAACWLYMSVGIGLAFIENPVTKPGLAISAARPVLQRALGALEEIARTHDYGVISAFAPKGIARYLERNHGFTRQGERVHLSKRL